MPVPTLPHLLRRAGSGGPPRSRVRIRTGGAPAASASSTSAGADRAPAIGALVVTVLLVTALLAGCAGPPAGASQPPPPSSGAQPATTVTFAPYLDLAAPHPAPADALAASGQRRIVLAFAIAGTGTCRPTWGPSLAVDDGGVRAQAAALRAAGGTTTAATGGESGTYLEQACPDAGALAAAYGQVLDVTGADRLDLDIEHPVPADLVANAASQVQHERGTALTVTVPVESATQGIDPSELPLLRALAARGVAVTVNAMLLDFPADGSWHDTLLAAADTVAGQVAELAHANLGLTVMAGRNDNGVITTLDDARALLGYARTHQVAYLGLWSLARDNGGCPGQAGASDGCSGIAQDPYAFTAVLSGAKP